MMTLIEAIELVAKYGNDYAKAYANQALMQWHNMTDDELKIQCLYIVSNIVHWRHAKSGVARAVIKKCAYNK